MKKNYTFFMALVLLFNLNAFSQGPWDFTNDNSIWASTGTSANLTADATYSVLDVNGAGNPQIVATTANISTVNNYAIIKIQNNTSNTRMRLIYNTSGTNRFSDTEITANDTEIKTYYVKCDTHADWTGTVDNITFQFKLNSANQAAVDDGLGNFYIDDITMATAPIEERLDYTFDNVNFNEGFIGKNGVVLSQPTTGQIMLAIDDTQLYPKFEQGGLFSVDASTYKGVEMTLINDSPKNLITFVSTSGGSQFSPATTIIKDAINPQTVYVDLTSLTNWTGKQSSWFLQLKENNGVLVKSAGTIHIQQIKFIPLIPASINDVDFKDDTSISLYPNPVAAILNVNSPLTIEKIEVYNVLGQQQKIQSQKLNAVDVSSLSKGMYFVKIYQENNRISTKRFIKN